MQSEISKLARRHARLMERIAITMDDDAATALWHRAHAIETTLANTTPRTAADKAHALSVVTNALQVGHGETDLARIVRGAILYFRKD